MGRRGVLAGAGVALLASRSVAGEGGVVPAALPSGTRAIARLVDLPEKRQLVRLVDRPPNYATPVDVFSGAVTPNDRFFVRYHLAGVPSVADMAGWSLSVGGAVDRPVRLGLDDLRALPAHEVMAVCQCAGNRRGYVDPHVAGVEWTDGAMGCASWRGPALRDVLKAAGIRAEALEVWVNGADGPVMDGTPPFRKSLPMDKALDGDTIIAVAMNNAPLPLLNGYPVRLIVPGWTGTYWMKHLTNIEVSASPLKNFWMQTAYRVPAGLFAVEHPFQSQVNDANVPITELVVNSVIADPPEDGEAGRSGFTVRGVAWDRGTGISRVEVSLDGGGSWRDAVLDPVLGRYAYRGFSLRTGPVQPGIYRLMSQAVAQTGERQAERMKVNPGGYHNNVPRAISVTVT